MPSLAQRWLEQGKQQGFQQGIQQGIQQGLQQGMHELVIEAIEAKFGSITEGIRKQVLQTTDKDKLKAIHRVVLKAEDMGEFQRSPVWK